MCGIYEIQVHNYRGLKLLFIAGAIIGFIVYNKWALLTATYMWRRQSGRAETGIFDGHGFTSPALVIL